MDLLKACDEMKVFIETAQKLVDAALEKRWAEIGAECRAKVDP